MDELEYSSSILANVTTILGGIVTIIGGIFSIWYKIVGPERATEYLKPITEYLKPIKDFFQNFNKIKPENLFISAFPRNPSLEKSINLLFILLILITSAVTLTFFGTKPTFSIPEPEIFSPPINWTARGGMNIYTLFWMYILLFAYIGTIRGWAKELLITFSITVALSVNLLLERYIPLVRDLDDSSLSLFWIRVVILLTLFYFGYQTVNFPRLASKASREKLEDSLFGAVLGGTNGYLITGSILFYFHRAEYPYQNIIAPATDPTFLEIINRMMAVMPPRFVGEPGIYFAVVIILIFIIIVYI